MSSETILTIQAGESTEDFVRRIADTAPQAPPDVLTQLRDLLRIDTGRAPKHATTASTGRAAA